MRPFANLLASAAVVASAASMSHAVLTVITFEEGVNRDGQTVNTQYTGVTFTAGASQQSWRYLDTGVSGTNYNTSQYPSGTGGGEYWVNDRVGTYTGVSGNNGQINFNAADATFVQVNYSFGSTGGTALNLRAFNSANVQIAAASGAPNLRFANSNSGGPGTLRVDAPAGQQIAYVTINDSGNYWVIDNVVFDAGGVSGPGGLQISKFYDLNSNGTFNSGETLLAGWSFLVSNGTTSQTVTTGASGTANVTLNPGTYTVTELQQVGWVNTTPLVQTVVIGANGSAFVSFGNNRIPEPATLGCVLGLAAAGVRRRRA